MKASLAILAAVIATLEPIVHAARDRERRKVGLPLGGPNLKHGRKRSTIVDQIRAAIALGETSDAQIARALNVSRQTVYTVRHSYVRPSRR